MLLIRVHGPAVLADTMGAELSAQKMTFNKALKLD
jgi:hypothetical protein